MNVKLKIKKDDKVIVITGRDKGKIGQIMSVNPKEGRVIVQGVNLVKRHQKQSQTSQGGIISKEAPIHVSNIALYDEKAKSASRVGYREEKDRKVRFYKKTGDLVKGA
jgi:large subunit ribosomal protein L24